REVRDALRELCVLGTAGRELAGGSLVRALHFRGLRPVRALHLRQPRLVRSLGLAELRVQLRDAGDAPRELRSGGLLRALELAVLGRAPPAGCRGARGSVLGPPPLLRHRGGGRSRPPVRLASGRAEERALPVELEAQAIEILQSALALCLAGESRKGAIGARR